LFLKELYNKHKNFIHKSVLIISVVVFLFSLYKIVSKLYGYYHDDKQYREIREQLPSGNPADRFNESFVSSDNKSRLSSETQVFNETMNNIDSYNTPVLSIPYETMYGNISELDSDGIIKSYTALKKQNPDLTGWIYIPGYRKSIDYPVMKTNNNDYYLNHDFNRNYSYAGAIYMDCRNTGFNVDRNIILYGHAMNDYSMFGNLRTFPDRPEDHTTKNMIYLDLLNTRLEYEIFSTYYEKDTFNYRQIYFSSDEEYKNFLDLIKSRSIYDFDLELLPMDKIITLSTCNNQMGRNIRSIIHARLVRQIVYDSSKNGDAVLTDMESSVKKAVLANVYLEELILEYDLPEEKLQEGTDELPGSEELTSMEESQVTQELADTEELPGETQEEDVPEPTFTKRQAALNPPFNTVLKEFSTEIPDEVNTVLLNVTPADPKALFRFKLNDSEIEGPVIPLEAGENIIKLTVISRDYLYARTYTIIILRPSQAETLETEALETENEETLESSSDGKESEEPELEGGE